MMIATWPVVGRGRLVQAFRPGESPTKEAPYRTLRSHRWATPGVRVVSQQEGRAAGRLTVFSVLNVAAARLARQGLDRHAMTAAKLAAELEASSEFDHLRNLLAAESPTLTGMVLNGDLPPEASEELLEALRSIARRTEKARRADPALAAASETVVGRISQVQRGYVILTPERGSATAVPRWMATAAHREAVGELLAVITDKLEGSQAMVDVMPALDMARRRQHFTPFGRVAPVHNLTREDEALLSNAPAPLRVMVPVAIGR